MRNDWTTLTRPEQAHLAASALDLAAALDQLNPGYHLDEAAHLVARCHRAGFTVGNARRGNAPRASSG